MTVQNSWTLSAPTCIYPTMTKRWFQKNLRSDQAAC